jgi:hypothetical protein
MHTEACAYAIKSAQRKLQPLCLSPFTPPDCNHVLWSHFAFIAICLAQAEDEEKEEKKLGTESVVKSQDFAKKNYSDPRKTPELKQ